MGKSIAWVYGFKTCLAQARPRARPGNLSIQLDTLIKAASAVGRAVEIRLKTDAESRHCVCTHVDGQADLADHVARSA